MSTATETAEAMRNRDLRIDRRYMRASQLTAMVMKLLDDHFEEHGETDHRRQAYEKLMTLFHDNGFDVVTDGDRERAGVAPRDALGWTALERADYERATLDAMLTPAVILQPPYPERD